MPLPIQDRKPKPKPGQKAPKARKTEKTENARTVITIYSSQSVSAPAIRSLVKILDEIPSPREFIYRVGGHFGLSPEINMVVFYGQIEVEVIS